MNFRATNLIDTLPPGLYEAVFEQKTDQVSGAELVAGEWIMRYKRDAGGYSRSW